jgi:hypothetical protein
MQIARFLSGLTDRTPLSASVMNEIVDAINCVLLMKGVGGIKVDIVRGNAVVGFDDETTAALKRVKENGGGGSGSLNWLGTWADGTDYFAGDIVRLPANGDAITTSAIANQAGTFVCLVDHHSTPGNAPPSSANVTATTEWQTLALGKWPNLWSAPSDEATRGTFRANGGDLVIDFGSRTNGGGALNAKLVLDSTTLLDADFAGKTIKPIKVGICVAGVTKTMWVLGCDPW